MSEDKLIKLVGTWIVDFRSNTAYELYKNYGDAPYKIKEVTKDKNGKYVTRLMDIDDLPSMIRVIFDQHEEELKRKAK